MGGPGDAVVVFPGGRRGGKVGFDGVGSGMAGDMLRGSRSVLDRPAKRGRKCTSVSYGRCGTNVKRPGTFMTQHTPHRFQAASITGIIPCPSHDARRQLDARETREGKVQHSVQQRVAVVIVGRMKPPIQHSFRVQSEGSLSASVRSRSKGQSPSPKRRLHDAY